MKKYVDYKPLYISEVKTIKEEQDKIRGLKKWSALSIIIFVISFTISFYFNELLSLFIIICIWSLFALISSVVFIRMYKSFIRMWEKFEKDSNESWQELEDKANIDWNNHFDKYRLLDMSKSEIIKMEKNVIEGSIKNVQKLVSKRLDNL